MVAALYMYRCNEWCVCMDRCVCVLMSCRHWFCHFAEGLSHLKNCAHRITIRLALVPDTRCTHSYTTGGKGGCGIPRERKRRGWVLDKVAGVLKKKRKNQKGTPLRVARVGSLLFFLSRFWLSSYTASFSLNFFYLSFRRHALIALLADQNNCLVSKKGQKIVKFSHPREDKERSIRRINRQANGQVGVRANRGKLFIRRWRMCKEE